MSSEIAWWVARGYQGLSLANRLNIGSSARNRLSKFFLWELDKFNEWNEKAKIAFENNRYEDAAKCYGRAIEIFPCQIGYPPSIIYLNKEICLIIIKNIPEAIKELEIVIRRNDYMKDSAKEFLEMANKML